MIHRFPQYGNSLLVTGTDKRFQGTLLERAQAELVLHERESSVVRLRVWRCRFVTVEETSWYKQFKIDYPSMYTIFEKQYDGWNFNPSIAEYIVIPDITEAVHFKLKYLC